jgi:hypothetical protein
LLEAAFLFVDRQSQCFHWSCQVIGRVLPDGRCFEHLQLFRERERLAYQSPIHLTRSQVGAFDLSSVGADQPKSGLVAINDFDLDLHDPASFALFDDLQIMPIRLRLLFARRESRTLVERDFPPGLNHCLSVSALSIGRDRRWRCGVTASFDLFHQLFGDFFFGLGEGSSDA